MITLQPVPGLSLGTGRYIVDYLAARAGTELGTPAARPEHRPLPGPIQAAGLQLLQGARLQSAGGPRGVVHHRFVTSPFDGRTPFGSVLNARGQHTQWGMSCCATPTSREADDLLKRRPCRTAVQAGREGGNSRGSWHGAMIGRWKRPVYSKLFCEARPKLSTEQEKGRLMGHFFPNYPEEEGGGAEQEMKPGYTIPSMGFTAPSCGQTCTPRWREIKYFTFTLLRPLI